MTFTPYTSVRYALTTADLVRDGDADPVEVERGAESDVYNTAPVAFLDRVPAGGADQAYNETTVEDSDPYHSQTYGIKRASRVVYDSVCLRDVAVKLARLRAQRWVQQRNTYSFSLPWRFCRLEPFDLVSVPVAGETKTVKILAVRESDDHATLEIQAEDWLAGANTANAHTVQSSDGTVNPMSDLQSQLHEKSASTWSTAGGLSFSGAARVAWHEATQTFVSGGSTYAWSSFGGNWTNASIPPSAQGAIASDGTTLVVAGSSHGATSTDGDTWTAMASPPPISVWEVQAISTGVFVAAGTGAVYRSSDSGVTWTAGSGWPAWSYLAGMAYVPEIGRLIAIGGSSADDVRSFIYSDDNGATWSTAVELCSAASAWTYKTIASGGGRVLLGGVDLDASATGDAVLSYTDDGGSNWTSIVPGDHGRIVAMSYTGRVFVAVRTLYTAGPIGFSGDGASWTWTITPAGWERSVWGPPGGIGVSGLGSHWSGPLPSY